MKALLPPYNPGDCGRRSHRSSAVVAKNGLEASARAVFFNQTLGRCLRRMSFVNVGSRRMVDKKAAITPRKKVAGCEFGDGRTGNAAA